jgi:hypothetical protein
MWWKTASRLIGPLYFTRSVISEGAHCLLFVMKDVTSLVLLLGAELVLLLLVLELEALLLLLELELELVELLLQLLELATWLLRAVQAHDHMKLTFPQHLHSSIAQCGVLM